MSDLIDKNCKTMREKKLSALSAGLFTDCSFLVGPENQNPKLFHAFSGDLRVASDAFVAMLRSPLTAPGPIRIKHIQPHIFKLLLEFVHVHTLRTEMEKVEEVVALTLLADEYLISPLKDACAALIQNLATVENVWIILNAVSHLPKVAQKCSKVLSLETKKCLEHRTFKKANLPSLIFFLQLDTLTINSEMDLIRAFLKLTSSRSNKIEMRSVLPYLRVLTLNLKELAKISKFLNYDEKFALTEIVVHKNKKIELPESICSNSRPRRGLFGQMRPFDLEQGVLEIIPKELLAVKFHDKMKNGIYRVTNQKERNLISFIACRKMLVSGVEILSRKNLHLDESDRKLDYKENLHVVVKKQSGTAKKILFEEKICQSVEYDQPFFYNFKSAIRLEKGWQFSMSVTFPRGATYANYFTGCLGAEFPKNRSIRSGKKEMVAVRFSVKHERKGFEILGTGFWKPVAPTKAICIVRSLNCCFL